MEYGTILTSETYPRRPGRPPVNVQIQQHDDLDAARRYSVTTIYIAHSEQQSFMPTRALAERQYALLTGMIGSAR